MKIYVCFISTATNLNESFVQIGEALIPKEIRQRLPKKSSFKFDAFNPNRSKAGYAIDKHILEASKGFDFILGLIEIGLASACENIRYALLSAIIDPAEASTASINNFFSSRLTKLFKATLFTIDKMSSAEVKQAMQLPIRNFIATELQDLCNAYRNDILKNTFQNNSKQFIFKISRRRIPRRESNFKDKYFIDDEDKYFIFGKESHEILPTGSPHLAHCELNGNYRFGMKILTDKHFNVSQGDSDKTYIYGDFQNCHNETINVTKSSNRTHLNMFSNDHC